MKKVKLSKKLLEESIVYCENYLNKKRKRPLPNRVIEAVKELIEKKRKDNSKFSDDLLKSILFKVTLVGLNNLGYVKRIKINNGTESIVENNPFWLALHKISSGACIKNERENMKNLEQ